MNNDERASLLFLHNRFFGRAGRARTGGGAEVFGACGLIPSRNMPKRQPQ
jgi:hypothetical protein